MFELSIATRHITTRRRQTALSLAAIALAVSISIVFMSLANGEQQMVLDIWVGVIPHVHVHPEQNEEHIHLYKSAMEKIWKIPGVKAVSIWLNARASLSYKDKVKNSIMVGTIPDEQTKISKIGDKMISGDLAAILGGRNIVLGAEVAHKLKARMSDTIYASFPKAETMRLTVVGIFETGTDWDEYTFVSQKTAREFLQEGDVASEIVMALDDPLKAESVSEQISNLGYETRSWQEDIPDAKRTLDEIDFQRIVTILLAMAISSIGIANIMNMLVLEKTREIGMLMALGASRSNIRRIFLFESGILGLIGTAAGSIIGLLAVRAIGSIGFEPPGAKQVTHLLLLIHPWDVPTIALLAVMLTIVAGVYPAVRASQLDPVEALKG
jgi:lipoprotein-releasing system permease protein